jgi:IrrE N-terminal-like domain
VRERRDPEGRMPYRLYYEAAEIDEIMEGELRRSGITRIGDGAVHVDAFIENHLHITPEFVTLPGGVQGATDFSPDGSVKMRISAALAERADRQEPGAENLMRTTLAHEAAHVMLHRTLFLRQSEALFGSKSSRQELCRDIDPNGRGYTGEWWEWQANRGMGALLLPRSEVIGIAGPWTAAALRDGTLVQIIARRYQVSTRAVCFRLEQIKGSPPDRRQAAMAF